MGSVQRVVMVTLLLAGTVFTPVAAIRSGPMRIVLLVDSSSAMEALLPQVRNALHELVDGVPEDSEIAIVSTGRQLRIRIPPTADRTRLHDTIAGFSSDGGANAFLDSLLEADARLLAKDNDKPSAFVIITTDFSSATAEYRVEAYNRFVGDFIDREGIAHAVVVRGRSSGLVTDVAHNLTKNTGGMFEPIAVGSALPNKLKAIAERLTLDYIPR